MEMAPCPSDIIWEHFNVKNRVRPYKVALLNLLLFVLTIIFIAPISVNIFLTYCFR